MKCKGIELNTEPSYGSVKRVKSVSQNWLINHIPMDGLDPTKDFGEECRKYMFGHPDLLAEFMSFNEDVESHRLIMLCSKTPLTYQGVVELSENMGFKEFNALVEKCKSIIGFQSVEDFLSTLQTNMSSDIGETEPQIVSC